MISSCINIIKIGKIFLILLFILDIISFPTAVYSVKASDSFSTDSKMLSGRLDKESLSRFNEIISKGNLVRLSSAGGKAEIALDIADIMKSRNDLQISIEGICLSACAEILLPAAVKYSNIKFVGTPIIGFHQNSEIFRMSLSESSKNYFEKCLNSLNQRFLLFSEQAGRKKESFALQLKALSVVPMSGMISKNCLSSTIKLGRSYWFPTSNQLRSIFSIDVPGDVCADSSTCIEKVLAVIGKDGERFLVGESEFIITRQSENSEKLIPIKGESIILLDEG